MRKPSEYLPAALAGLRSRLMPDCSAELRHGERAATVTRVGSPPLGADGVSGSEVAEGVRVLATASDFPDLTQGSPVTLASTWRMVVSAHTDPTGTTLSLVLSAPFADADVAYAGTRRKDGAVRTLDFPLSVLMVEDGPSDDPSEVLAPTYLKGYTIAVREEDWTDETDPEVSDTMYVDRGVEEFRLKVSQVERKKGFYVLHCRERG